jgi:hypothetical protein
VHGAIDHIVHLHVYFADTVFLKLELLPSTNKGFGMIGGDANVIDAIHKNS